MTTTILGKPLNHKIYAARIIRELENEAQEKMKGKKLHMTDEVDESVTHKIFEYNRMYEWINDKDVDDQKKLNPILERIKSEAVGLFIKASAVNMNQAASFGLSENDILFEIEFKRLLSDWVELELDESLSCREQLRKQSAGGKLLDYSSLNSLGSEYYVLTMQEKAIANDFGYKKLDPQFMDERETLSDSPPIDSPADRARKIAEKKKELKKLMRKEKWKLSGEESKVNNLSFYVLYEEEKHKKSEAQQGSYLPEDYCIKYNEENQNVNKRIQRLSNYYLRILVRIICKINNELNNNEIIATRIQSKNMNRQKKKISPQDKRELILMGKAEGLTNVQISRQLGKGLLDFVQLNVTVSKWRPPILSRIFCY